MTNFDFYCATLTFIAIMHGLFLYKIKGVTITDAFQNILGESNCKSKKIWVNTYHSTIEMKRNEIKPSLYFEFGMINNDKDPKFKYGDHLRISKYKNIFAKSYVPNWS